MIRLVAVLAFFIWVVVSHAQIAGPAAGPLFNGHFPLAGGSLNYTPPVVTCNGTIDLSTGCVQPMLGGL